MKRINSQVTDSKALAAQVLSWIICAVRPLNISELQHALAVEIGESELDEENLPEIEIILSVCAGLVTLDEQSGIVRLVHYTTQEYFQRTYRDWFPNAQSDITMTCITYLLFDVFEAGSCLSDEQFETRLQLNQLYNYVARNWGYHANEVSIAALQLVLSFFENKAKLSACTQAMLASKVGSWDLYYSQNFVENMTELHLSAYFDLQKVAIALISRSQCPDVTDSAGKTPLSWAAERGHEAMVQLLLETSKVDAESKDKSGQTPLSQAAKQGHEAVVQLLLETGKVDADSTDKSGKTPLLLAAEQGHKTVIQMLLKTGKVDTDSKDKGGQTPLSRAAQRGHDAVVQLLLETGSVDLNSKDNRFLWVGDEDKPAVRISDSFNDLNDCRTPLLYAAMEGHDRVVKLLLTRNGIDADFKDGNRDTPLSWAAENGHEEVVKLLLTRDDVDPNSMDNVGWTPLLLAAANGNEGVVKLLLEKGVDLEFKTSNGRTPLMWAIKDKHEAVVRLLLEKGAKLEAKDNSGRTPLWWAVTTGQEAVMKLLLEHNDDI